jgi:hypothetical protein
VAVGAEKSADPVQDAPARDALFLLDQRVMLAPKPPDVAEALYKPVADLSAEQSFVAQAFAVQAEPPALVELEQAGSERMP